MQEMEAKQLGAAGGDKVDEGVEAEAGAGHGG